MQTSVTLASRPEFSVHEVNCLGGQADWSGSEQHGEHRLVLVRRGSFRRSANGVEADLDRTTAYLAAPGEEERFAHLVGGDLCTSIGFSSVLWGRLPIGTAVYVDARIELAHRRLLLAAATGDADYATAEELLKLVAAAAGFSTRSLATDDALAAAAVEAIIFDVPEAVSLCLLAELAAELGFADQAHLTRTVREHVGLTPVELRRLLTAA